MKQLLSFLRSIPEYSLLLNAISNCESAAVTGLGQVNRSHTLAALHSDLDRPLVLICQDDIAARRLQEELKAFCNLSAFYSKFLTDYYQLLAVISRHLSASSASMVME